MTSTCLFCDYTNTNEHTLIAQNDVAYARWDNYAVNPGHAEVIPKRHVHSFFDLDDTELLALYALAKETRDIINITHHPDGFTIGVNDGEAAGRTIHHLHIHLIPRYIGDVENPRGGVRHIIPGKGNY